VRVRYVIPGPMGRSAAGAAELLVHANLHPSKAAYPLPPKLRGGTPIGDFLARGPAAAGR
jgi:hypothetical protein